MGNITSRQNAAIEEADIVSNHAYKYPPRSGNFFGSHFIMGGERFDTPQPEAYLFGENGDLNFLGNRPTAFPYPPPQANEPTKTLKSLVNIRKESVRFVKAPDSATKIHGDGNLNKGNSFNIEFTFDSDAKCAITIYHFCTEEVSNSSVIYNPRDPSLTSETYHFKKGINQHFSQTSHIFNPSLFSEEDLSYNPEKDVLPVAIHCIVEEGSEECRQSHTTICVVDRHTDGTYVLRALKQKIFVDGLSYLLQEIYGIENKALNKPAIDDDTEDNGSECVICMSDTRDTLILPCRHLCLCNSCADSLRYQANNCPICRAPFRALLQIRAVQKGVASGVNVAQQNPPDPNCEHIPSGYIPVSLIEALNGPPQCINRTMSADSGEVTETDAVQAVESLNKNNNERDGRQSPSDRKSSKKKNNSSGTSEFRMSVLLTKEDDSNTCGENGKQSPPPPLQNRSEKNSTKEKNHSRQLSRDSLHIVNERHSLKLQNTDQDEDSETEKLSPLLSNNSNNSSNSGINSKNVRTPSALHIDGVDESIDDTDTDAEDIHTNVQRKRNRPALPADGEGVMLTGNEDSDYYTPEDPHTTILSPLCSDKSNKNGEKNLTTVSTATTAGVTNTITVKSSSTPSIINPPLNVLKENAVTSLPDSPISGNSSSTRSSGDSYSSSSSTKQLLGPNQTSSDGIKILDDKSPAINA